MGQIVRIFLVTLIAFNINCRLTLQQEEQPEHHTIALQHIYVGAIFYEDELYLEQAFESAIERINTEPDTNFRLLPVIRHLNDDDDNQALQSEACLLIENGVAAIFGPSSKAESDIVALICNYTGIPHIQFDVENEEIDSEKLNHQMSVNVYPSQLALSKAYADIIQTFGWKKFTIVYDAEDVHARTRLQDLLQLRDVHNEVVRVRKFKRGDDYRILWKSIKGERRIILDCAPDMIVELLESAAQFELTGQFNNIFLTNLDTHNVDMSVFNVNSSLFENMEDIQLFEANVTAARLELNGDIYNIDKEQRMTLYNFDPESTDLQRTVLPDLIYDAVFAFAATVRNVTTNYEIHPPRVTCNFHAYDSFEPWLMGQYMNKLLKLTNGLNSTDFRTTNLLFNDDGQRISFNMEIYEPLDNTGLAIWHPNGQITPMHVEATTTKKKIYRVATRFGEPYFMENPEAIEANLTGNERYMGYAVDLIQAISEEVGFEYLFVPVPDNAYGKYDKDTKQWNGIIGELINNDAHMGICDLTITTARRQVVDFTVPFMQLGISILAYKQQPEPKLALAFLDPFHMEVWIYVMIAIFVITFIFVFVARISKDEWENPHPCNKNPDTLENMWNLGNSLWLTMGSIMTAGSDILPKSAPMRTLNGMWWIFAIIIANSYTANLAAFLTNVQMENDITGIKDLAEQTKVKFGTIEGGSTYTFFSESNETTYRLAFNIMNDDDPSAYTKDNPEGVERVLKNRGNYMFLMETTGLEYNIERNCELRAVGEKFGEKHYAIAVPFGAEYRSDLSVAILKLSERGKLFDLKKDWWENKDAPCPEEKDAGDTPDMGFEEVRGIFYTLGVGVFIAFLLGIAEFLVYVQGVAVDEKLSFKEAFKKEIIFVACVWNNKKPITGSTTTSSEESSSKSSEQKTEEVADVPDNLNENIEMKNIEKNNETNLANGNKRSAT